MPIFFPRQALDWRLEEPAALRRVSLSLVAMGLLAGSALRLYRALVYGVADTSSWAVTLAFLAGAVILLFGTATLYLGNFPIRSWLWRVPGFAMVTVVAEVVVSLLLIQAGREPLGSGWATMDDWPAIVLAVLLSRVAAVALFALVLAAVVQMVRRYLLAAAIFAICVVGLPPALARAQAPERPLGTLREQGAEQQQWLARRMDTVLPALMREHGVDMWVIPMREYNEDPVFSSLVSPTTFAARRRTIYVFHDQCAVAQTPQCTVERLALGGSSQGGVFDAFRSQDTVAAPVGGRQAELWGDEQWNVLRRVIEERDPRVIAVNISPTHAFSDGLTASEYDAMRRALGTELAARFRPAERLPLDLITVRLPEEEARFRQLNALAWEIIETAFSNAVITPGTTTTQDVVWWMRQRVNDLGLSVWFHPSVGVQRAGVDATELGEDPVIQRGDVLWCDFGITGMRLNTDTQHMGYVLRDGESSAPAGIQRALGVSNRLQDIVVEELRPGRTGNEILATSLGRMREAGIDGTVYSHPIGLHGHGAGPLIGRWDNQAGVPGRGDVPVIRNSWYSVELQATTAVPEWNGQRLRVQQEEDVIIGADGVVRWAHGRQTELHLVR